MTPSAAPTEFKTKSLGFIYVALKPTPSSDSLPEFSFRRIYFFYKDFCFDILVYYFFLF